MEKTKSQIIYTDTTTYYFKPVVEQAIFTAPVLILVGFSIAWFIPFTHKYALWISKENHPAELLTFVSLLAGSIIGTHLAWRLKKEGYQLIVWLFIALFSGALFIVSMEEIAWGQQFFHFSTPDSLMDINEQNELTLHNIQGLHRHSEYFHLFFGLAGIIGVYFNLYILNAVRIPYILSTWFIVIALTAVIDLTFDYFFTGEPLSYFARRLSEINEMMIGLAGFGYLLLLTRKFSKKLTEHVIGAFPF